MSTRTPSLGVHLLETITRGMYNQPMHCIREYVQNGYDSVRAARRARFLAPEAGTLRINMDPTAGELRIRDDGLGLSPEAAAVNLLDIGSSEKARSGAESRRNAGFRGIGRMAGISYCRTLRFRTSDGSGRTCVVEFDAAAINRLTLRGQEPATIVEAIEANSRIDEEPAANDERYLEVTLEGLAEDSPFLDQNHVDAYLGRVAPVRHDRTLWRFGDKIQSFARDADSEASLETISVLMCDSEGNVQADVRRPFKTDFQTKDGNGKSRLVRVTDVLALPRNGPVDGWWGWVAVHERRGALAEAPFCGLRVRSHNIAVGDETIARSLFKTQNLSAWCFGEIHVTHPDLVPNAQRDDFEPSREWDRIKTQLREEAHHIDSEIRGESTKRSSSLPTLKKRADKKISSARRAIETGIASDYQQQDIIQELRTESDKIETQTRRRSRTEDEVEQLAVLRETLNQTIDKVSDVRRTGADIAQAHLNRQARQVFRQIMDVLRSELDDESFRKIETKINAALRAGQKE